MLSASWIDVIPGLVEIVDDDGWIGYAATTPPQKPPTPPPAILDHFHGMCRECGCELSRLGTCPRFFLHRSARN